MAPTKIHDRLFFDDIAGCGDDAAFSYVHACKDPCHRRAVGYTSKIDPSHAHYLAYETPRHLYLNLIDPPVPLFKLESFKLFFDFVDRDIQARASFEKQHPYRPSRGIEFFLSENWDLLGI